MVVYLLKRMLLALITIWGVLTIVFIMMHLAPGDVADLYLSPEIRPEVVANIRHQLGLDQPIWVQYYSWIKQILSGNPGISFVHKRPVSVLLAEAIPNTLLLTMTVIIGQFIFGSLAGILTALKQGTWFDRITNFILLFFYSMPGFWVALLALLVFSLKLGWLPSGQMQSVHEISDISQQLIDRIRHLILPAVTLSIPFFAYTTRFVRDKMIDVLSQPYISAAYSYGLPKRKIVYQYALKNAMLPLITLFGLFFPFILSGTVITEYIFSWPGMGRLAIQAIFTQDYPLILTTTTISALAVIAGNFMADVSYRIVDPRIRKGKTS